jgi:hypothetical protein
MRVGALQDAARDQHARRRAAGLAEIAHGGSDAERHAAGEIGIRQHNIWRLAAELLRNALDGAGRRLRDENARPRRAGDRDHVDLRVCSERLAYHRPRPVDEVEDARRAARLVHDLGEEKRVEWRELTGFQYDHAACR